MSNLLNKLPGMQQGGEEGQGPEQHEQPEHVGAPMGAPPQGAQQST